MEKYLKWENCSKSFSETLPLSGKTIDHEITRQITCSHPKIEKVWLWGGTSGIGSEVVEYLEILTKDGERYSEKVSGESISNSDFPKAEEWLQSLNSKEQIA